MPTSLARVPVAFEKEEHSRLVILADAQDQSLAGTVHDLVGLALQFIEDLALGHLAEKRLATFKPEQSLDINEVIKWNRKRKAKGPIRSK